VNRRVVITGIGMLTPLGTELEQLQRVRRERPTGVAVHDDLLDGEPISAARVEQVPVKELVQSKQLRRMDRVGRMAAVSSTLALQHGGVLERIPDEDHRFAVSWASEFANLEETWSFQERLRTKGPRLASPMVFPNLVQNAPAGYLSIIHGLRGPTATFCHHETCGMEALEWGARQIRLGRADLALAGITEEVGPLLCAARKLFHVAEPPGEGSVALLLEEFEHARARGATVHAEVLGLAAGARPHRSYRMATAAESGEVLDRAIAPSGLARDDLAEVLGLEHSLVDVYGESGVLALLHVAIEALAGELPAATVTRARGGVTRAVVLGPPHEAP